MDHVAARTRPSSATDEMEDAEGSVRVLILGAHRMLVDAFRSIMSEHGIEVLDPGDADGAETVLLLRPDVVVIDCAQDGDGIAMGGQIQEADPGAKMIALTARSDRDTARSAMRLGFEGFITEDARAKELSSAIRAVAGGGGMLLPRLPRHVLRRTASDEEAMVDQLTAREREVLLAIVSAASSEEIARRFSISVNTVRSHIQSILTKLQVHSRLEAAAFAARHGFVPAGWSGWGSVSKVASEEDEPERVAEATASA